MTAVQVAALYRFARLPDPAGLVLPLQHACEREGVKGILLVANEGINGTIAGQPAGLAAALTAIRSITGFEQMELKYAASDEPPFLRMKVKLKREIVTIGDPGVDPLKERGAYVAAQDWNRLMADPNVVLIDVRNDYEHRIGTFAGAIDSKTSSFRDFPAFVREQLADAKDKTIAMFCTGGIRCEKASAFMMQEGFETVFQLQGGILRYLAEIPEIGSRWQGGCFVFDDRVAVGHGLAADDRFTLCHGCRKPLTADDCQHPEHEEGVACRHCAGQLSVEQRRSARERHKQMKLARLRGVAHIGPQAQGRAE